MQGFNVLHPMGFDSFGLAAETYAMKMGTHPKTTTEANIDNFRKQIKRLGFSYDWQREVSTHKEDYYRWTQWIFLKLYEKGLAYEAEMNVWYCEALGTVLANEEVLNTPHGPISERGNHPVVRRPLRQWVLKITAYAERLLQGLETLDWPESLKAMQRNWIGKSEGANVRFALAAGYGKAGDVVEVFTTRPDTLYGATYMVLAPEHPLVARMCTEAQRATVDAYKRTAALKSDLERTDLAKDKTGAFTGAYAINPLTGKEIPVWISDYILASYGTGAIMAVPAHDERDWAFAKTFGLPIVQVVAATADGAGVLPPGQDPVACFAEEGFACNSGEFNGMATGAFKKAITAKLEAEGKGIYAVNYKIRDWIFSRQRYWGEPIPLVHTADGCIVPEPYENLPLTLPEVKSYKPAGNGESPLAECHDWLRVQLPDGRLGRRETNTMPQWAGSCWYYLRYIDPKNTQTLADSEKIKYWMPVDLYVGGAEHAVLHLLYARFWHKVLFDIGVVNTEEPFQRLVNQGMITSYAFQKADGALVPTDEVEETGPESWKVSKTGESVNRVIAKMSKSLKNVINPDEIIAEFGADSMRLYEMFMGPLTQSKPWSTQGLVGIHRFLERVWRLTERTIDEGPAPKEILRVLHKTIKKVAEDTKSLSFNTAISQMMILVNDLYRIDVLPRQIWEPFALILAPYAPHLAEELWQMLGHQGSLAKHPWPAWDEALCQDDEVTIAVQVNGKVRATLTVAAGTSAADLEKLALANERVQEHLGGKAPKKVIAVPNKIVNIVA
jgi:leucyl-tRNA synthetase